MSLSSEEEGDKSRLPKSLLPGTPKIIYRPEGPVPESGADNDEAGEASGETGFGSTPKRPKSVEPTVPMAWWEERETPARNPDEENEPEEPPEVERPRSIIGDVRWPSQNRPDIPDGDGVRDGSPEPPADGGEDNRPPSILSLAAAQVAEASSEALQPLVAGANGDASKVASESTPSGDEPMRGGAGQDVIHGFGSSDLIFGEGGADRLQGNDGFDTLYGGDGQDRLKGEDGSDLLRGGADGDSLVGGDGNDVLFGEAGDDRLLGNAGSDLLSGGVGNDQMKGGTGFDALLGGEGQDSLRGESGRDYLFGQSGNDRLSGGSNRDTLFGGQGDDRLYGGEGEDVLKGGAGEDRLWGEAGQDEFVFDLVWDGSTFTSADGADRIYDFDLSSDFDQIRFQVTTTGAALGQSAEEVFSALDSMALVADDGADTTISIGGMSVELRGISGPGAAFTSIGGDTDAAGGVGINADTQAGPGGYDAITVVVNEVAPIATVNEASEEVRIDLTGFEGFEGFNLFEVVDPLSLGSAHVQGTTLVIRTEQASGTMGPMETQLVSLGVLGFATETAAGLGVEEGAQALREFRVEVTPSGFETAANANTVLAETLQNAPIVDPSDTSDRADTPAGPYSAGHSGGSLMNASGAKSLTGGFGPDMLVGSDLDDRILGLGGADRIVGMAGDDLLSGGAGADEFVFKPGSGRDTIIDFEVGFDVLVLEGMVIDDLFGVEAEGGGPLDTLVSFSTGDSVILLGVTGVSGDDLF